jgi:alpha-tubulin suppressor-like RCC1 family protein
VRADGSVVAWGDNSQGQCTVPPGLTGAVAVAGGGAHSVALGSNGIVTAWGENASGQCAIPMSVSNAVAVAAGESHTLVLLAGHLPVAKMLLASRNGSRFSTLIQTLNRKNYALQFEDSMADSNWTALPAVTGNGALRLLVDPGATAAQRFYRVQQW